jgi:ABC-type Fe3+ transport system permease subunit
LTQFAAFYDLRAATVTAAPLLLVTIAVLGLQTRLHKRVLQLGRTPRGEAVQIALGASRLPLFALVLAFAVTVVALPLGALIIQSSAVEIYGLALARAGDSIVRSIVFASAGASLLAVLGFFCGYLADRRTLALWWTNEWLGLLLLALPGSVKQCRARWSRRHG